ncbi:Phage portal protein [Planctomycetes bacterium Pan216]|uniref:Phage portal protein n=1 Tax=Kolteria novifilia TaxID=2527975 RepID=A0A518B5B0_9BACT|nr:Phage portal protein [Planctomycetes bacterium Pan216]
MIDSLLKVFGLARLSEPSTANDARPPIVAGRPKAGVYVNEDIALTYMTVWTCVKVLAETFAALSWHVYQETDDDIRNRRKGHPVAKLLRRPNPRMTAYTFKLTMALHLNTWGNAYAEIVRNRRGDPIALWPLEPHRVTVEVNNEGRIIYKVANPNRPPAQLNPEDVFHVKGMSPDGLVGYSPIQVARESISLGLACQQFASEFFGNGANPGAIFEHPGEMSEEAQERFKKGLDEYRSGHSKVWKALVTEEGMKYQATTIPAKDAQFLETRKFQRSEIAGFYRVPAHKIGDLERATFSNIEQQAIEFVTDAMLPVAINFEQEADAKLFNEREQGDHYTKVDLRSLLRGDSAARAAYYQILMQIGVLSVNEVRRLEDMNPVPGGDLRLVPLNMTTLEQAARGELGGNSGATDHERSRQSGKLTPTRAAAALGPILQAAGERLAAKETNAVRRAASKYSGKPDDFSAWLDKFVQDHRETVVDAFTAPLESMGVLVAGDDDERRWNLIAETLTDRHLDHLRSDVADAFGQGTVDALLEQWSQRPTAIAAELRQQALLTGRKAGLDPPSDDEDLPIAA